MMERLVALTLRSVSLPISICIIAEIQCGPCVADTGVCRCSGDPHCQSFDGKWLHFQGACKYTLARDGCADGAVDGDPSWEVIGNFDRQGSTVSYVRQVTVKLYDEDLVSNHAATSTMSKHLFTPDFPFRPLTSSKTWRST